MLDNAPRAGTSRRALLASVPALAGSASLAGVSAAQAAAFTRVRPGMAGWPKDADWAALRQMVEGRLEPVTVPQLTPEEAPRLLANPFYIGDQAGLTQSSGWVDAWRSAPSAYVVRARDPADVSAAVRFAAAHRLRLVVKGGGHSYMGGSCAPDSLLVWTRAMDRIELHDAFTPQGSAAAPVPAVSVGAGCLWGRVYEAVTVGAGRYVQGGGCTTVGVAGLVQGGGFGSFSKTYGIACAGLIEAEIVTADGKARIVNAAQDPDLYWALKGGGGGTFGVVTRLTLATHDLPTNFGVAQWSVQASSDAACRRLLARFIDVYAASLFNPHWGEQVAVNPSNRFSVQMLFAGVDGPAAHAAWAPLESFVLAHPEDYKADKLSINVVPPRLFWNSAILDAVAPGSIRRDPRPGAGARDFWWAGNTGEAGTFWHGYASTWLPQSLLEPANRAGLVDAWYAASRHWQVAFHFNKGMAGSTDPVRAAARETATNPEVADAFALAIMGMDGPSVYPPLPQEEGMLLFARGDAASIRKASDLLRQAAPDAGCYMSECDFFNPDWRRASWGPHAARLEAIKRRYDPDGLFIVHHGVGSDRWSADGFTRIG
jgi:FAD/FMN-containing dehydrogenase